MRNRYEVRGDVTVIYTDSPKYGDKEILIDTRDLEKVKSLKVKLRIQYDTRKKDFYARVYLNGKNEGLHRIIANAPKGKYVDHINGNPLDNRRANLRIVTTSQNLQNRKGAASHSKSGVRGVYWQKQCNKWTTQVVVNGKKLYFGMFDDIKQAEKAVKEARKKYLPYSIESMEG